MSSYNQIDPKNEISDPKNHSLDTKMKFGPFGRIWAFLGPNLNQLNSNDKIYQITSK